MSGHNELRDAQGGGENAQGGGENEQCRCITNTNVVDVLPIPLLLMGATSAYFSYLFISCSYTCNLFKLDVGR
jgi:hypothetical protein